MLDPGYRHSSDPGSVNSHILPSVYIIQLWPVSSVGRALHSHCKCQGFESLTGHNEHILFVYFIIIVVMNLMNISKLVILSVVVVLVPILLFSFINTQKNVINTHDFSDKAEILNESQFDIPSNFKTYSSSSKGYSFAYPQTWEVRLFNDDDPQLPNGGSHTLINYNSNFIDQYVEKGNRIQFHKFLGSNPYISLSISVNRNRTATENYIQQRIDQDIEGTKTFYGNEVPLEYLPKEVPTDITIGNLVTTRITRVALPKSDGVYTRLDEYIAFPNDTFVIHISRLVASLVEIDLMKTTIDWEESNQIIQSVRFK